MEWLTSIRTAIDYIDEHLEENISAQDVALYFWPSALIREFITVFASRRFFPWAVLG